MRHGSCGIVNAGILEPSRQPLGPYLVSNARQFGTHVAAHQVPRRILNGVARRAERFAIQARSGGWIGVRRRLNAGRGSIARLWRAGAHQIRRDVAGIRVAELVIGHRRRCRECLGVFEPAINPLACRLVGDVRKRRRMIRGHDLASVGQRDSVAVDAAVARQHGSAQVELRCSGQRILVALAAAGLNVTRGQDRFLAGAFAVVRFGNRGGRALPAMADDATESVQCVRNCRVFAEGLLTHVAKTGLIQSQVAGGAAVNDAQIRQPYLMNARLESAAQADSISAIADQSEVATLIAMPLAEVLLCRRDRKRQQQAQADNAECPHRIAEQRLPRRGKRFLQELHLTPPGPYPGPAWAAEPCAYSGEHNEFKEKPRHDPVSQRLQGQITTQP